MMNVLINREIEGGHGNLLLRLKPINFSQIADTYYFALDDSFMHGDESEEKVVLNLRHLLECWINVVKNLRKGEVSYLPFDFSDQYVGCMRVEETEDNNLVISYGSTRKFEGSSFSPTQCEEFVLDPSDYDNTTDPFILEKSVFLESVLNSIEEIKILE